MEVKRKCDKCKSTNLTYDETWEVRHWAWWQILIAVVTTPIIIIYLPIIGIPLLIYLIYVAIKKKKRIYTYICQDCGFTKQI